MKPLTNLYLKSFAYFSIPFGVGINTTNYFIDDEFNLRSGIITALLFGLFMSVFLVWNHKTRLKNLGISAFTEEALSPNQTKIITSTTTKEELIERLKSSLYFKKMKMSSAENKIDLIAPWGADSGGERITIEINSTRDTYNIFQISSKPKIKFVLVDGGKNTENILKLEKLILAI